MRGTLLVMRLRHLAFEISSVSRVIAVAAVGSACAVAACSDSSSSTPTNTGGVDGGGTGETGPVGSGEAKQTGKIVGALDKLGVEGATISIDGKTASSKADGTYEIVVPKDKPYTMSVSADGFFKLNEQEWILKKDQLDRGETSFLSKDIGSLLASFLPARDSVNKGLLVVRVLPVPPCDSEQGTTVTIAPAGASKATYFSGGRPNQQSTSTTKGEAFSVAFSDVDPGVNIVVTANSPLCEQLPWPQDQGDVTYTGNQKAEAGDVLSYIRVFIGPKKTVTDAGTD